jgi:NTP pyrophosphatase (non-canonical NTP hydrolase)
VTQRFNLTANKLIQLDSDSTVSVLKRKVEKFRNERDWQKFHNAKDLSIALSIESSELEEIFLWKSVEEISQLLLDKGQLEKVKEEVADIGIYLLSLSSVLNIDLSDAITKKLAQNALKYPIEKSKGSSKKYIELKP